MGMGGERMILVVEDDDDLRELEARFLERASFRVSTARDGVEALARVALEMPAAIFLDMCMPSMDGPTFAREFRARHDHLAPIVVVTAAQSARARAAEIDADGFIGKPFELKDFIRAAVEFATGSVARP
jgi:DNA-binding response OmpR family regulator